MTQSDTEKLNVHIPLPETRFLENMRKVSEITGKTLFTVLRDIWKYQYFKNKLEDYEYFKYMVYDDDKFTEQGKSEFIGAKGTTKLNTSLNRLSRHIHFIDNKIYFQTFLAGTNVKGTKTIALFGSLHRFPDGFFRVLLRNDVDVRDFLANAKFPLFGKPTDSYMSLGTVGIEKFDVESNCLHLINSNIIELGQFVEQIHENYNDTGYMFQEMLKMHNSLADFTGKAVGTLRVVTIWNRDKFDVLYAAWKIPAKTSMADNFWRHDNLIAHVDAKDGQLLRCQKGVGLVAEEISHLPPNDTPVESIRIPDWKKARDLSIEVSSRFPDNRILGFDIALTDDGPVVIEANTNPDHGLYQIAAGRGFLNSEHRSLIEWNKMNISEEIKKRRAKIHSANKDQAKRIMSGRLQDFVSDVSDSQFGQAEPHRENSSRT